MNRLTRNIFAAVALLLWVSEAGAAGTVNIIQQLNGEPAMCAQSIVPEISNGTCTLTVTDISTPYKIKEVTAVKVIDAGNAQSRKKAPGMSQPIEVTAQGNDVYTFAMPAEACDVEVTVDFDYRAFSLTVNGIAVTGDNMLDILGTADADSTLAYNGKGVLILNQNDGDGSVTVSSSLGQDLTIYIKGVNNKLQSVTTTGSGEKLFITTDPNNPGMLTLQSAGTSPVISNFTEVELEGLVWRSGDATAANALIGVYIKPITEEKTVDQPKADDLNPAKVDESEKVETANPETDKTIIINKVVDEVLYTVEVQDEAGNAVDVLVTKDEKTAIVLNTAVDEAGITTAMNEEPGTADFAKAFEGVTFKLAAGAGVIVLDVEVDAGAVLNVKIGDAEPVSFTNVTGEVTVPYVLTEATYVYIYNATPAMARGFRAKIKTAPVRMFSVSVAPEVVAEAAPPEIEAVPEKPLTEVKDENVTEGAFALDDETITTLADNVFSGKDLKSIDLTKTSITGITVSRSSGPFNGVDSKTFIYLPAGNDAGTEKNVIIGGVCNDMQLTEDDQQFAPSLNFGAVNTTLGRDFVAGQTSTVYLPFDLDKAAAAALGTFYTFAGITNGEAVLEEVTTGLVANTPYIFRKTADGQVSVKNVTVKKAGVPVASELIGTYKPLTFTSEMITEANAAGKYYFGYAAAAEGDVTAGEFVQVGAGATIKPYRAYLLVAYAGSRLAVSFGDDQSTGIVSVGTAPAADGWYTISGTRLQGAPAQPGLYIHNGKKMINK